MSEPTGFLIDATLCVGCKACEVACKSWNLLPGTPGEWAGDSYDNTVRLSASTWRHVAFVERIDRANPEGSRWSMLSDSCKHCTHAACIDACPTGAIVRNEFGQAYIQPDVCNGCGYCVPACPFGVVAVEANALGAHGTVEGLAQKCTGCYDRQKDGLEPACSKACPTDAIAFGALADMQTRARERVKARMERGETAYAYGFGDDLGEVGDLGAIFVVPEPPQTFGLPERPVLPRTFARAAYTSGAVAALALVLAGVLIFAEDAP